LDIMLSAAGHPARSRLLAGLVLSILLLGAGTGCQRSADAVPATGAAAPDAAADTLAVPSPDSATAARFEAVMDYARRHDLQARPVGTIMQRLGARFGGAPYLEGTLDAPDTERLVVRLDGFDCVTYVETLLAMARGVAQGDFAYESFARRLAEQRYEGGRTPGYCRRLHYFSAWVRDNDRRGLVRDLTAELGGRRLRDTLTFMSTHRDAYRRFATNDSLYACVQQMERDLVGQPVHYVPQDSIRAVYDQLQAGDILGLVTRIDGLDIAHTGLAFKRPSGEVGLLHASTSGGVMVSPDLQRYVQRIPHQIGILVARPEPPAPTASDAASSR
jgi:hypothetical protein